MGWADAITGCPLVRECLLACWLGELSQQSVAPQFWHVRRWTHRPPIFTHSAHSRRAGCLIVVTAERWAQVPSDIALNCFQKLMDELNRHGAFSDRGGDAKQRFVRCEISLAVRPHNARASPSAPRSESEMRSCLNPVLPPCRNLTRRRDSTSCRPEVRRRINHSNLVKASPSLRSSRICKTARDKVHRKPWNCLRHRRPN